MVTLGKEVKCIITGFTGIATAKIEYLNGCTQFKLTAKVDANNKFEELWFDWNQLQEVGGGVQVNKSENGGPVGTLPKFNRP